MVYISKKNKAQVLSALYNRAKVQGLGVLQYEPGDMSIEEAEGLLQHYCYFDYLKGRVMKIDLSRDIVDTAMYNRDNGSGAAEAIIASCPDIR